MTIEDFDNDFPGALATLAICNTDDPAKAASALLTAAARVLHAKFGPTIGLAVMAAATAPAETVQ